MIDFKGIEEKWNNVWNENKTFKVLRDRLKPPFYAYTGYNCPSIDSFIKIDAYARYMRMNGYNVLFPAIKGDANNIYGVGMDCQKVISDKFLYTCQVSLIEYLLEKDIVSKELSNEVLLINYDISDFYEVVNKMNLPKQTLEDKTEFFGIKEGNNVIFQVNNNDDIFKVYIDELEKLFLTTFVIIPYHIELAKTITSEEELEDCIEYINNPIVDDLVYTGKTIYNPITEQNIPVFVGDVEEVYLGIPSLDSRAMNFANKYELDISSMDFFDDFSPHLRKEAYRILSNMNALEEISFRTTKEVCLARKENGKYVFNPLFDCVRFMIAPIASHIDLDINILLYKEEINKWLPIDIFCFQDGKELFSSLLIHHIFHKADFIQNIMFAKKIVYHNPRNIHSHENSDICRILVYTQLEEQIAVDILQMLWHIYSYPLSKNYVELDAHYHKLKIDVKKAYEGRDYNMVMAYVSQFMSMVNEKKGFSEAQALGLLKMISPIMPYMAEEIYHTVFNQISTIAYEEWPE